MIVQGWNDGVEAARETIRHTRQVRLAVPVLSVHPGVSYCDLSSVHPDPTVGRKPRDSTHHATYNLAAIAVGTARLTADQLQGLAQVLDPLSVVPMFLGKGVGIEFLARKLRALAAVFMSLRDAAFGQLTFTPEYFAISGTTTRALAIGSKPAGSAIESAVSHLGHEILLLRGPRG